MKTATEKLNDDLRKIKAIAYDHCKLIISDLTNETEGLDYNACKFKVTGLHIISRTSKITPKKFGQFVTCWKRKNGITTPYEVTDQVDFYLINVTKNDRLGQFIFPKSVLIEKGIISTSKKEGKRGFRVYPIWDKPANKQAEKTQKWQLNYFVEYDGKTDLKYVRKLFQQV